MNKKVLVIAPHADDEILGCGATIAKHIANGDEVFVLITTNAHYGYPERYSKEDIQKVRNEALSAHKFLGIKRTYFTDFPAPKLDTFSSSEITDAFLPIFNEIKPDILYIPHGGDLHLDHTVIYRASLVAARPIQEYSIMGIYVYETLSETNWSPLQGDQFFKPNLYINVTDYFEKKLKSMSFFTTQIKKFPNSRSLEALEALAKYRGSTVGVFYAEAFMIEREIWP